MNIKKLASMFLASSAIALSAAPAQAGLVVSLKVGATTVTVADGSAGDLAAAVNEIAYFGSIGNWTFNLTGAVSSAPDGNPGVHFSSSNSSISGGGTVELSMWTDAFDFTNPTGNTSMRSAIGGTTAGMLSSESFLRTGSPVYVSQISQGPFTPGAYSNTASKNVTTGTFDVKQVVTITHAGAGSSSFDADTSVPEPVALGLLGLGLLGFGFARRRFAA